ncbi:hypothetical protein [Burkholderia gladioli]|uniref:hypothetical protein n=1 Tax=Burkholderia gladioli TaxID=28095 RepID=UPI0016406710|nr:hypothetical protein [Burkholderia gladioli]
MSIPGATMAGDNELPGLRSEYFINSETGETDVHYLWHGVQAPKVKLSGRLAQQISGLSLIEKDLKNARRWMQKIFDLTAEERAKNTDGGYVYSRNRELFDDVKAFFVASLTFYGKAFTEAEGRNAQMSKDWLAVEFRDIHEFYMEYRHNFAAHSGDLKLEGATSFLVLLPGKRQVDVRLTTARFQPDFAGSNSVEIEFLGLLDHAIEVVQDRYLNMSKRLVDACLRRPLSFWFAASQSQDAVNMDAAIKASNPRRKR